MAKKISGSELIKYMKYADEVYKDLSVDQKEQDNKKTDGSTDLTTEKDYKVVKISEQKHGFYAALIKNKDGTYVLPIRGTDSVYDFVVVDMPAFFYDHNIQYPIAKKFFDESLKYIAEKEKVSLDKAKSMLVLDGDSLGANIAQILGAEEGVKTFAFNPLYATEILEKRAMARSIEKVKQDSSLNLKEEYSKELQIIHKNAHDFVHNVEGSKDYVSIWRKNWSSA